MSVAKRGHNKPPEVLELAKDVFRQITQWFKEHPKVSSEKDAREIKLQIDRAKLCLKDLEDERDGKVRPLNEQVGAINARYKEVKLPLGNILDNLLKTLDSFIEAERVRREKVAEEARRAAEEAERKAREAERIEREKMEDAILDEAVDVEEYTEVADVAFGEFERAARAALRAQEDTRVKVVGGLGRAITQREREVLEVEDPIALLKEMGLPENVKLAMLTAARAFKKVNGRYPKGIKVTKEKYTG